jgi:vitamin B12 transporter
MKTLPFAGLVGLASLGSHAQVPPSPFTRFPDPVVVTATRALQPAATLHEAIVITREDIEQSAPLSLGELLEQRADIELRATGGPGQPQGIFIRGAGAAQTLVLVDGLRVGSATQGGTSIENIPLELIERIEVVKGPLSSLYGSEAAGGVVQIFTRGKSVPHLFATVGYGSDNDRRAAAGVSTVDKDTSATLSMGYRKVDAPSATNPRVPFGAFDPDKDPYENAYGNLRVAQKLWQGEVLALEAFGSRARTRFDSGIPPNGEDDYSDQTIGGARITSSDQFASWWTSKLAVGTAVDKLAFHGQFPSVIETRQDQGSWINEITYPTGSLVAGLEGVRQYVKSDDSTPYDKRSRDTRSGFAAINESWQGNRLEASARRDHDDQFGNRNTGSVGYGYEWPQWFRISGIGARGFRAPTFNDLYARFPGYTPQPNLKPERSESREYSVSSATGAAIGWRLTRFDNKFEDLIVFDNALSTVRNVSRARIRGWEGSAEGRLWGVRWRAQYTQQNARDEDSGKRLQGRADRHGTLDLSRGWGSITAGLTVRVSGPRFDSIDEDPTTRLPGHGVVDARVGYAIDKHWSVTLHAANLGDKRYENAFGYDAPRRQVLLNVKFEAF